MHKRFRSLALGFLAVLAVSTLIGWIVFWRVAGADSGLDAALRARLEESGIVLTRPDGDSDGQVLDQVGAEAVALEQVRGEVNDSALYHVAEVEAEKECLCWVIEFTPDDGNFAPSSGPAGNENKPREQYDFSVVFVDARSGEFVTSLAGHE
jgi:hypothetical protein